MNTWTCKCGEMNAGSLGWCRCGMAREPLLASNQLSGKTGKLLDAVHNAKDVLRFFDNKLASSLSCDSRSHDSDQGPRQKLNAILSAIEDMERENGEKRENADHISHSGKMANRSEAPKSSRKAMAPEERLNKTERAFLEYLKLRWETIGIQSITLRLAWGVRYTPDFWTKSDTTLHFWEVKGFMRDDARKSLMFAAKEYQWATFWLVKRDKSQPNGWSITQVQR